MRWCSQVLSQILRRSIVSLEVISVRKENRHGRVHAWPDSVTANFPCTERPGTYPSCSLLETLECAVEERVRSNEEKEEDEEEEECLAALIDQT
ncbi:hypothetical protein PoB_001566200 [Plakobranchus ocellatus]|uniref:Secreted protein n=1 Tax=Plakobranchus ocellatus TaxID=259542 RepID=A0AAV3Z3M7_9GAST|nr:hypothetical protein PoB_001566200 [Plakobranchus ocellatus]